MGTLNLDLTDNEPPEASADAFIRHMLRTLLSNSASALHLEPLANTFRVRYRVDGDLRSLSVPETAGTWNESILSRIKEMAQVSLTEKRIPLDGQFPCLWKGEQMKMRYSSLPTTEGESIVLRVLKPLTRRPSFLIDQIGLSEKQLQIVKTLLESPTGMILVAGPGGSGRTTTIYSFLLSLSCTDRRIATIEDPVEVVLPGVTQVPIDWPRVTHTIALHRLRDLQPDIIFIDEMHDCTTLELAMDYAKKRLVFSTLRSSDPISGICRLEDIGSPLSVTASTVSAVISQRLIQVLCPHCRVKGYSSTILSQQGFPLKHKDKIYRAVGCKKCNRGYAGRTAIYEICLMTDTLAELIQQGKDRQTLYDQSLRDGMMTFREAGWQKVNEGITSVNEVLLNTK